VCQNRTDLSKHLCHVRGCHLHDRARTVRQHFFSQWLKPQFAEEFARWERPAPDRAGGDRLPWTGELIFAMAWLVLVLSIAAVGLLYWLIRRSPATGFASLFYLVPVVTAFFAYMLFGERLDTISILGMVICAGGVALVNRGVARPTEA
jgi:hypothetical protein